MQCEGYKASSEPEDCHLSSFEKHVSSCDTTRSEFSLEGISLSSDACNVCTLPHRVMEYFKANVHPDHHQLLEDCKTKILLYQGHHVQVINQQKYIDKYLTNITDDQAYLVMDFKMKFEAMYYREKTTDFYRKKG
jgi:hypothetical protein